MEAWLWSLSAQTYGSFSEPVIEASQQQLICAWLETDINTSSSNYSKRLRYQLFSQTGAPQLPQAAILPGSGAYARSAV
jgi:hypothetical protein